MRISLRDYFESFSDLGLATCFFAMLLVMSGCSTGRVNPLGQSLDQSSAVAPGLVEKFAVGLADDTMSDAAVTAEVQKEIKAHGPIKDKKKLKLISKTKLSSKVVKLPPEFVFPDRRIPNEQPIWIGEKAVYEVTYLGAAAGTLEMTVLPFKKVMQRKVYHLVGHARTNSIVSSILYRVDDRLTSYMDYTGLFSHRYEMKRDETKLTRESLELFDHAKGEEFYGFQQNHIKHGFEEGKEMKPIARFAQDSFSALFYLRFLPLEVGKVFTFPVVSEGKSWDASAEVLRVERADTPFGVRDCFVVKPETRYQGAAQQKRGASYLWITKDDRRVIVRVEAKVKIGTVIADLKSFEPGTKPKDE